jgi:hypothetical protein
VHSLSTFGAKTNHEQIQIHKTHHGPNLREAITFPLYSIFCASSQGPHPNGILSQDSQTGVPKFPKWGLPRLWGPITLCADLRLRWSLKPSWELSNGMSHATCIQGNRVNSRLLMLRSQTANLTPSLSFSHNLCFRCPNGWCKPILDIYISMAFQWYKDSLIQWVLTLVIAP